MSLSFLIFSNGMQTVVDGSSILDVEILLYSVSHGMGEPFDELNKIEIMQITRICGDLKI